MFYMTDKLSNNSTYDAEKAVKQAKALAAFQSMRKKAEENGYLTDEEINAEITAARNER